MVEDLVAKVSAIHQALFGVEGTNGLIRDVKDIKENIVGLYEDRNKMNLSQLQITNDLARISREHDEMKERCMQFGTKSDYTETSTKSTIKEILKAPAISVFIAGIVIILVLVLLHEMGFRFGG